MKTLLTLALVAFASASFADSPAQITADYREKAAAALAKVNETLETATVPLVAALVKAGDTAGAAELQAQLKAKTAGDPVAKPQSTAISLFKLYDAARSRAMEPVQQSAVKRINALLAGSEGKNLDTVAELGKARAEVEAGKVAAVAAPIPMEWTYHIAETSQPSGTLNLNPDGSFELLGGRFGKEVGSWKPTKKEGVYSFKLGAETAEFTYSGALGLWHRGVGLRYMKPIVKVSVSAPAGVVSSPQ